MTFEGAYRGNPDARAITRMVTAKRARRRHPAAHAHHARCARQAADGSAPAHESPWVMLVPLMVLAAGAVFGRRDLRAVLPGRARRSILAQCRAAALHGGHHEFPAWVIWAPLGVTVTGFLFAVIFYLWKPGAAKALARGPVWAFLYNKWYFDEIYDFVFVKGARAHRRSLLEGRRSENHRRAGS